MNGPDYGYEPWARAAIERGDGLTHEMGVELLATIDTLRKQVEGLTEEMRRAKLEEIRDAINAALDAAPDAS